MKQAVKLLLFLLSFTLEIRVHAADRSSDFPEANKVVTKPHGCYGKTYPCRLKNARFDRLHIEGLRDSKWTLIRGASFGYQSKTEPFLQFGDVVLQASKQPLRVSTFFGSIYVWPSSRVFLKQAKNRTDIIVLGGYAEVSPKGHGKGQEFVLPMGYQMSLGPVQTSGKARVWLPEGADLKNALAAMDLIQPPGGSIEFQAAVEELSKRIGAATAESSRNYIEMAQRYIASVEVQERRKQWRRRRQKSEQEALRKLFREKNYLQ